MIKMRRSHIVLSFALAGLLVFGVSLSVSKAMGAKAGVMSDLNGCYFGIFREGAPANMAIIAKAEKEIGKKFATIMWYQDWSCDFPKEACDNAWNYGAVPHIVWEPWYWGDMEKIKLDDINGGKWDDYIRTWAREIKAWGKPVFLRVAHEFNIDGYPWGIVNNGKDPKKYISAYRRVVDIFKREGATNAKWIWCYMNYSYPDESWNDYEKAYPGDDYVDWVGIDGYNWGTTQSWSDWQSFSILFRDQMRRSKKLHPTKPIMVAEFGCAEKGGNKAAWIKELPGLLKGSMRDIDAIIWFDIRKETDWRISSSTKSLDAFKSIIKDPFFLTSGKGFADLTLTGRPLAKKTILAKKATNPVTLNGDLSDFADAAPITLSTADDFKEGSHWYGIKDLSGKVFVKWDSVNLYVGAKINDNVPLVNQKIRKDIWNGDGVELVMSTDPGADPKRTDFSSSDFQIGLGSGDGKLNKPAVWIWQRTSAPKGTQIVAKKTSTGYVIEAKIPWTNLNNFKPSAGKKVGFDVALDDADTKDRKAQLIWNGDFAFYRDPSVWGVLEFVE